MRGKDGAGSRPGNVGEGVVAEEADESEQTCTLREEGPEGMDPSKLRDGGRDGWERGEGEKRTVRRH